MACALCRRCLNKISKYYLSVAASLAISERVVFQVHSALLLPSHYSLSLLFTTLPVALKRDPAVVFDPNNLHHVLVGTAASSARHASAYLGLNLTASMSTLSHGTKPTRLSYYLARCLHCTTGWVNCANESSQAALERASQDAYDVTASQQGGCVDHKGSTGNET